MKSELIAPCGNNCATCVGYFGYTMSGAKRKHTCPGCREANKNCAFLKQHCELLAKNKVEFCHECSDYPCSHLLKLQDTYTKKYDVNIIENLDFIRDNGMEKFLRAQEKKFKCPTCSGTICVHTNRCYSCSPL
ncbi:MAG: DUF3795 domain-containing protein [Candidatus Thorarchaeota archaeon]